MTTNAHEPIGTTAEVTTRTHVIRSIALVAPALLLFGAIGWTFAVRTDAAPPAAASPLPAPTGDLTAAPTSTAPATTPPTSAQTVPATVPPTAAPPPTVAAPVLTGASLVTAGEPIDVSIDAPRGLQLTRPPANGLVQIEASGRATYIPDDGFVGVDDFAVQSCNEGGCGQADVSIDVLPDATSAYVNASVETLVDTRSGAAPAAGSTVEATLSPDVDYEAVALSVTLIGSQTAGGVEVDGGSGPIAALAVPGAGAMTTNLVIVPADGDVPIAFTTSAGGHLVVDLVGYFVSATESAAGRFVQVDPIRAAHLVTAVDGREATVDTTELAGLPVDQVGAVLALVTADVGPDGGSVRLGPGVADYDQMLMWGAPTGSNLERRGVVLITPDPDGRLSFDYEGGSEIDVDVLGYFTNGTAPTERTGLYVPSEVPQIVQGDFAIGNNVVGELPGYAGAAFVTLTAEPGVTGSDDPRDLGIASGRTIGTTLGVAPTSNGTRQGVVVTSASALQAQLQVLGIFLAGSTS